MEIIYLLVIMVLLQWFGDFVLQSDDLAFGKHRSFLKLIKHSFIYALPFLAAGLILFGFGLFKITIIGSLLFFMLTFLTHLFTDYTVSSLGYRELAKNNTNTFLGLLMFDQLIHLGTLALTFTLLF